MKRRFLIFLVCLSALGVVLGLVATSRYGAGVTADSVKYLSVAQNLLDGNGLIDHRGITLVLWPPLYSIVLAGVSLISRLDVLVAATYLNVFLNGLNLYLGGLIFWRAFSDRPIYAYLGGIFAVLSISSLRVHATIFSEPLYLTMTLGLLLALDEYIRSRSRRSFVWILLLSALAPMQRYVGLALGVTAMLVIIVENRRSFRAIFVEGLFVTLATNLPIGWWLLIHNLHDNGTLWGGTSDQVVDVVENTSLALTKIFHWFIPYLAPLMPILLRPFWLLAAILIFLSLLNFKSIDLIRIWGKMLTSHAIYPALIYGFVYLAAVMVTSITSDHQWLYSDRYHVIVLVPVLLLTFLTFDVLILPRLRFPERSRDLIVVVVFAVWCIYPLYGMREYLSLALERGEPSEYNLYNTRAYHEMKVVVEMQLLRNENPDVLAYSNYVDAVWFYTRKPTRQLPTRGIPNFDEIYKGWPGDNPGYLIWFKPNEYKHYLSPKELLQFANVQLIYSDESGDIYLVMAR